MTSATVYKQKRSSHDRPGADVLGRKPGYVVPVEDRLPIVTEWSGMGDYNNCPPDYETFYKQYWSYAVWYVKKFVQPEHAEDIAQELIIRFLERDSIGVFSRDWESRSQDGKSKFRTYFLHFMLAYCPGKKRNLVKYWTHYLTIYDAPVGEDGDETWGDLRGETTTIEPEAEFDLLVEEIRERATPEQAEVVDTLLRLAIGGEKLSPATLSKTLGIDRAKATKTLDTFRQLVSGVL